MRASTTTPKGQLRRNQLMSAAADILRDEGIEAVRHRLVAERAGASLASTTYYFESLADLVLAAVESLTRQELEDARARLDEIGEGASPEILIDLVLGTLLGAEHADPELDRRAVMLRYEWLVAAGRRPYLHDRISELTTEMNDLLLETFSRAGRAVDPDGLERMLMVMDGAVVRALSALDPSPRDAARAVGSLLLP